MLAAQAHIPNKSGALPSTFFADLPATSNSCNTSPNSSSSSGNYMISQTVSIPSPNSNLSPTSVSSSASCFIYPPLIGRCHLVSDKIIDIETSVLAFSQVRLVRLQHQKALSVDEMIFHSRNRVVLTHLSDSCITVVLISFCVALQDGSTALMYAAQAGNIDAVIFLVSRGSNTEQQRKVTAEHSNDSQARSEEFTLIPLT